MTSSLLSPIFVDTGSDMYGVVYYMICMSRRGGKWRKCKVCNSSKIMSSNNVSFIVRA